MKDASQSDLVDVKIPFQAQILQEFVGHLGRLFYDDACIVLLDFLAREQRAFQESDLRDILGWRESLIQQKLYLLDNQLLLCQDLGASRGSTRPPVFWRISHYIQSAVQFRYQQVVDRLAKLVEDATQQHEFECSNDVCSLKHSALDVASCSRSLEDEHPLCLRCGSTLKASAFEETLQLAKKKRIRALQQLESLRQSLLRIKNMEIPLFPPYTKQEKKNNNINVNMLPDTTQQETESKKTQSPSGIVSHKKAITNAYPSNHVKAKIKSKGDSQTNHTESVLLDDLLTHSLTPKKSINPQSESPNLSLPVSRSIPWFDDASKQPPTTPVFSASYSSMSTQIANPMSTPQAIPPSTLSLRNHEASSRLTGLSTSLSSSASIPTNFTKGGCKINFGIKKLKLDSASSITSLSDSSISNQCKTGTSSLLQATVRPDESVIEHLSQNKSFVHLPSGRHDGTYHEHDHLLTDVEIHISKLGRKIKISEITEDIEQHMTDEEYKIYYNASSELTV